MKTIILTSILALAFTATSVGALATYTWKANDTFVKITNQLIDTDGVTNYKFTDKIGTSTITCFGSYAKRTTNSGSIVDSMALSCIK